jgi:hypothetical protein
MKYHLNDFVECLINLSNFKGSNDKNILLRKEKKNKRKKKFCNYKYHTYNNKISFYRGIFYIGKFQNY